MKINAVLAAVAVADMETAVAWYEQLLGQPPTSRPMPSLAEWQIEGGHLQVVHDPARAGASLLTLDVSHLDDTAAEVTDSGLVAQTPTITQGDTVRFPRSSIRTATRSPSSNHQRTLHDWTPTTRANDGGDSRLCAIAGHWTTSGFIIDARHHRRARRISLCRRR
jgi:predicted enzyme related to lactoylglutathione lyase